MTSSAVDGACAFARRNYLLLHNGVSENDNRRSALYRYVTNLRDTREYDFDLLQIAAVAYLQKLDELHDERGAHLRQIRHWPDVWSRGGSNPTLSALSHNTREGENSMGNKTVSETPFAHNPQERFTAATAISMNALKPIMHAQVSMLRMWADSIERFAGNYQKGFEETRIYGR